VSVGIKREHKSKPRLYVRMAFDVLVSAGLPTVKDGPIAA
jgi:hypothetical protein